MWIHGRMLGVGFHKRLEVKAPDPEVLQSRRP